MSKHIQAFVSLSFLDVDTPHMRLTKNWQVLFGNLAQQFSFERIVGNTIIITIADQHWMHHAELLKGVFLKKIKQFLMMETLVGIKFQIKQKKTFNRAVVEKRMIKKTMRSLSSEEEKALADITDKELRRSLELFLQRCEP